MSLTAQWKLQDNAASTTVVADVGSNGTLTGAGNTSAVSVADGPGTALTRSFQLPPSPTISYIAVSVTRPSTCTICLWTKFPLDTSVDSAIFSGNLYYYAAGASFNASVYNSSQISSGYSLITPSAGWHHLACVTVGSSSQYYLDGSPIGSTMSGALPTSITGLLGDVFGQVWANKSCDLRIYDSDESASLATIMAEKDAGGGIAGTFYNANGPGTITLTGAAETVNVMGGRGTVTVTGSAGTFNADNGIGKFVVA